MIFLREVKVDILQYNEILEALSERVKSNIGDFLASIQMISFLSDEVDSRSKFQTKVSQRSEFCKALAKVFQPAICYSFAPLFIKQLFKGKKLPRKIKRDLFQ